MGRSRFRDALLEDAKLRITATDHAGITTATEIPKFRLFEDREAIHEFRVPARLASLNVTLQAKVKSLSQNKALDLAAGETFAVGEIERTEKTEDLHLAKFGTDYVIELLGRSGESKPDRAVLKIVAEHFGAGHCRQSTIGRG